MEITIALALSILGSVISVLSLIFSRRDKSNKDTKEDSYKWGQIDAKLSSIEKTLTKIENKLDSYDKEVDEKIAKAIQIHVDTFHKRTGK